MTIANQPHGVTHTFKVTQMVCLECEEIIAEGLAGLDGVLQVRTNWLKNVVIVTYDLRKVRLDVVLQLLTEIGFPPDSGFFQRKKRAWIRFSDQNVLDHMKHQGACCSKPPHQK